MDEWMLNMWSCHWNVRLLCSRCAHSSEHECAHTFSRVNSRKCCHYQPKFTFLPNHLHLVFGDVQRVNEKGNYFSLQKKFSICFTTSVASLVSSCYANWLISLIRELCNLHLCVRRSHTYSTFFWFTSCTGLFVCAWRGDGWLPTCTSCLVFADFPGVKEPSLYISIFVPTKSLHLCQHLFWLFIIYKLAICGLTFDTNMLTYYDTQHKSYI